MFRVDGFVDDPISALELLAKEGVSEKEFLTFSKLFKLSVIRYFGSHQFSINTKYCARGKSKRDELCYFCDQR